VSFHRGPDAAKVPLFDRNLGAFAPRRPDHHLTNQTSRVRSHGDLADDQFRLAFQDHADALGGIVQITTVARSQSA
jgi:hypothetical protein